MELDLQFTLQYEDPDFDGRLTSLVDIKELPQKSVLHITFEEDFSSSSSVASTEILSDVSSPERLTRWPLDLFPVPTFSFDVELKLREGNAEFEKTGRPLKLTRDQKHDILDKLASTIYGFSAYPSGKQIAFVAEALVTKHPCLKEAGSNTGWNGWKNSLLFKMGNYRNKMRRAGCIEVSINAGKRSQNNPDNESPHSGIKRPKRAEVNFLPNFPKGENSTSLECLREQIIEELKKTERNLPLIGRMMQTTFALRRQTIIQFSPPVKEILDLWPALRIESEVYAEFQRITNQNLRNIFYAELDRHIPRLMTLFRQKASKTGKIADSLAGILKVHDEQELHDIHTKRTTVLHALPVFLREDWSGFLRTCKDIDEAELVNAPMALITLNRDNTSSPVHYQSENVLIVIESEVVITLPRFVDALVVMFSLIYALHLSYPKGLTNTFEFFQKILLSLEDGKLSPRLQTLKNDLMIYT
ncbi:uncharacterized protein LOC120537072 [Polypterus senegalus]|uniref:uncharacterized protein LOC120537072 n=1 Tax=Polypterus senegalus TaxID=55291 RepID=UPI001962C345|nr:uncharacterized protein LOC120537072 [Polypterus senegalus]